MKTVSFQAPNTDFDVERQNIERQRQYAQLLRQQAKPAEGQMVGNIYVPPSWTEQLATLVNPAIGSYNDFKADERSKALAEQLRGKREAWMGEMPRSTPNTSEAGPAIPSNPTTEDYMAWAAKGMQIDPQMAQLGLRYGDAMEARADRSAQLTAQQTAAAQARQEAQDFRAQEAEKQRQLQLQIAGMRNAQGSQDPKAPVAYVNDKGETVWGTITEARGRPAANFSPLVQGQVAGAKASGQVEGKESAEAKLELPKVVQQGEETVRLVDELLSHPGFKQAVGMSRMTGFHKIPGTDAYGFDTRLKQLTGKQFLAAFESLKGGGQITEVEGQKATQAIARMDAATDEKEFTTAAREFQDIVRQGVERAKKKAGPSNNQTQEPPKQAPKRIRYDAQGNQIK